MQNKKYHWIKLSADFIASDEVRYLLSMENGHEMVVLYLQLLILTMNTEGRLGVYAGDIFIPYNAEFVISKTHNCSSFEVYQKTIQTLFELGLVTFDEDSVLTVTNHKDFVGAESKSG